MHYYSATKLYRHNDKDYVSCSHETPPGTMESINSQTIPWCATKVNINVFEIA